jgi:indolepyruvate ferredoxin oxidoreductase, beta subunit
MKKMKTNIIISGVCGQGILTIASVLNKAALNQNLFIKQSEIHGMNHCDDELQLHIQFSNNEIYSNIIPKGKTDLILSIEPRELLCYIPFLKKEGWIITDSSTFTNILDYPKKDNLYKQIKTYPNHIIINATSEAKKLGNTKVANMILLGAASSLIPLTDQSMQNSIKKLLVNKNKKIIQLNIKAFEKGKKLAKDFNEFVY